MAHNDVVEAIVRRMAPYLGETMVRAAIRDQCRKLGLEGAQLNSHQVETLLARMGEGLNLFVGRDQAARLVSHLRRDLSREGGAA